jgi:hypothetical protein
VHQWHSTARFFGFVLLIRIPPMLYTAPRDMQMSWPGNIRSRADPSVWGFISDEAFGQDSSQKEKRFPLVCIKDSECYKCWYETAIYLKGLQGPTIGMDVYNLQPMQRTLLSLTQQHRLWRWHNLPNGQWRIFHSVKVTTHSSAEFSDKLNSKSFTFIHIYTL